MTNESPDIREVTCDEISGVSGGTTIVQGTWPGKLLPMQGPYPKLPPPRMWPPSPR